MLFCSCHLLSFQIVKTEKHSDFAIWIISGSFKVVQNVLEHVLNVSPSSGRRVLPMAKVLAESLVNSSCGKSAVDFLEKLSLMVAIAVPGVHADLEAFSWRDLPLLLLSEEIHKDSTSQCISINDLNKHIFLVKLNLLTVLLGLSSRYSNLSNCVVQANVSQTDRCYFLWFTR